MIELLATLQTARALAAAWREQAECLADFHARAAAALGGAGRLRPWTTAERSIERNLFSTLFLAAQRAIGVAPGQWRLCALVNQCMRAWVTACDNLLDDESKIAIPFELPGDGGRFRSVLTLLTADRVLTDLLLEETTAGHLTPGQASNISRVSLRALVASGMQEQEEEPGIDELLPPGEILDGIHWRKTGLLFEAPIAVAEAMPGFTPTRPDAPAAVREGLREFGVACQILDDLVDRERDALDRRHNYVASLAAWAAHPDRRSAIARSAATWDAGALARAHEIALTEARRRFERARQRLGHAGLGIAPAPWNAIMRLIPRLLKLGPAEIAALDRAE